MDFTKHYISKSLSRESINRVLVEALSEVEDSLGMLESKYLRGEVSAREWLESDYREDYEMVSNLLSTFEIAYGDAAEGSRKFLKDLEVYADEEYYK